MLKIAINVAIEMVNLPAVFLRDDGGNRCLTRTRRPAEPVDLRQ